MTEHHPDRPWWFSLFPDLRAWATVGMFILVFYDLHLIATVPALADNELFKTVSTLLLGSGAFGLVCAFLWGGSKATVSAVDTVNAMARAPSPGPALGAPGHPAGPKKPLSQPPPSDDD